LLSEFLLASSVVEEQRQKMSSVVGVASELSHILLPDKKDAFCGNA
jgi:hypothetical protein